LAWLVQLDTTLSHHACLLAMGPRLSRDGHSNDEAPKTVREEDLLKTYGVQLTPRSNAKAQTLSEQIITNAVDDVRQGMTSAIKLIDVSLHDSAMTILQKYLQDEDCAAQVLAFRNNDFGALSFYCLAAALGPNASVTKLEFIKNEVGPKIPDKSSTSSGVKKVGKAISRNDVLKTLTTSLKTNGVISSLLLEENGLGDDGCTAIAQGLEFNASVKNLRLTKNDIGDEGCERLATALVKNTGLQVLHLDENNVSDRGVTALTEMLSLNANIKDLSLRSNTLSEDGIENLANFLATNISLLEINLRRNSLGDTGCERLVRGVALNTRLLKLHLSSNRIGDKGALGIASMLKHNGVLQEIYLEINRIQDSGCIAISSSLESNNAIKVLDLRMNSFGGAGYSQLAESVKLNTSLERVYLSTSQVCSWGAVELIKAKLGHDPAQAPNEVPH